MSFHVCYYHVVWATKNREPLLVDSREALILSAIMRKSTELKAPVHALNCVADHVHVAVSIPPNLAVAHWVKNVKGYSAYEVNATFPDSERRFQWQIGYGVLTFGASALSTVVEYIVRQKDHHRDGTLQPPLERFER